MANFTPSQSVIDFLICDTEEEIKTLLDGVSPEEWRDPTNKPFSYNTVYGEADRTMKVVQIVGSLSQYSIPNTATCVSLGNGITSIADSAFDTFADLSGALIIPNSVTQIGNNAFSNCANITSLILSDNLLHIGNSAFNSLLGAAGGLIIPDSVITIGNYAFNSCVGFTSLTLGDSVTSIGNYAFYNCSQLSGSVTIPSSVTSIGIFAFYLCGGITNINCYTTKSVLDVFNALVNTSVDTIHARASDSTWTAGSGQVIGSKTGITVIKDL